ncbi:hypothetical protein [Methylobacterium sp. WSM2598]|uniref:hypothetical protein n=1 Tax=Methylobacterium sp. WSM2598 TaxID=398261 RepID=UPI00035D793A|nr:hypothetical protein [Methylobacterium sp. WSM2598]
MTPILFAEDRSLAVPPGRRVVTGYVHVDQIVLGCRARMAIGDVDRAYQRRLQLGDHQPWPCPRGEWVGERFQVIDGRHDCVAALMLGLEHILVAWPEPATTTASLPAPEAA